ncbi:hypothetical protein M5D96_006720 [Drosophila gunungcola]|uniref:Uncharacterized protein n=1 Tax=Drosophila gunungcola TaxID=103775 RepID=A0A9Q0BQE4_9MUSC|nr:hypothetical protein M5D96_006720 [Drosophila gunungcola]
MHRSHVGRGRGRATDCKIQNAERGLLEWRCSMIYWFVISIRAHKLNTNEPALHRSTENCSGCSRCLDMNMRQERQTRTPSPSLSRGPKDPPAVSKLGLKTMMATKYLLVSAAS